MAEKSDTAKEIEKEIKQDTKEVKKFFRNYWVISTIILAILLIVVLANNYGYLDFGKKKMGDNAINFFNTQLSSTPGTLEGIKQISGIYQVMVGIQGNKVPVYFTKDGKFISPGYDLIPITGNSTSQTNQPAQKEIPKTDKPKVELYVMGFCPYGNLAENTMLPVYNLLKSKVDWNIHYIVSVSGNTVSSLHGQAEVDEDEREMCVLTNSGLDKWWEFATYVNNNCGSNGTCWKDAAKNAKLNSDNIDTCVKQKGLSLMTSEEKASNDAGVSGSPTLIINGVQSTAVYQYQNSDAYKQAICSAFTNAPPECSTVLTSAGSSTTSAGSCG